jgi:hypothetical protein
MRFNNKTLVLYSIIIIALSTSALAYNAPRDNWLGTGSLKGSIDMDTPGVRPTMVYDHVQHYSPGVVQGMMRDRFDRYSNWMRNESPQPEQMFRTRIIPSELEHRSEEPRLNSINDYLPTFSTKNRRDRSTRYNRAEYMNVVSRRINTRFDYTPRSLEDTITYGTRTAQPKILQEQRIPVHDAEEEQALADMAALNNTKWLISGSNQSYGVQVEIITVLNQTNSSNISR